MRNTVKLVLFSVLVLAVLLVLPNISNAADVETEEQLTAAINSATTGDVINLKNDITLTTVIEISGKNITINGNGNAIIGTPDIATVSSPTNKTLVTALAGAEVTLQNVTLKDSPKYGVQAFDGSVILEGVTITNCTYGGVLVNGGKVTIKDLTLDLNGENGNNGIEIDKGSSTGEPALVMDGKLKSYPSENVVRVLANCKIENAEGTESKVFVNGNTLVLTDKNDIVVAEGAVEGTGVTAEVREEKVIVEIIVPDLTAVRIAIDKDSVLSEETARSNIYLSDDLTIEGFYTDSAYEIAFDFSKAINENITIYGKAVLAEDTDDTTPPTEDDTTDPSEEEEVVPSEEVEGEKDETPKTGVVSFVGVAVAVIAIGTVSLVALKRKDA